MRPAIVHVADYGGTYGGGFAASLCALQRAVHDRGFRLVVALSHVAEGRLWVDELRQSGAHVVVLGRTTSKATDLLQVVDLVRKNDTRIVHTHFTRYDISAWAATRMLPRGRRISVVWHVHSAFPVRPGPTRKFKDAVKMRAMGRHAHAVAVSPELRSQWVARGFPEDRVLVIQNGIDVGRLARGVGRNRIREELRIAQHARVALVFGWEPVTKGIDLVLDAARILSARNSKIQWILVGGDPLRRFVNSNAPVSSVLVAPPREDVGSYYRASDVFVSASRWEGFPFAALEAAGSGVPMVCSDIAGVSWAKLLPGVRFFTSGDSASLADEVGSALARTDRSELAATAHAIQSRYSLEAWANQVGSLYDTILP